MYWIPHPTQPPSLPSVHLLRVYKYSTCKYMYHTSLPSKVEWSGVLGVLVEFMYHTSLPSKVEWSGVLGVLVEFMYHTSLPSKVEWSGVLGVLVEFMYHTSLPSKVETWLNWNYAELLDKKTYYKNDVYSFKNIIFMVISYGSYLLWSFLVFLLQGSPTCRLRS